ncbi:MAG: hypothetical protein GDA51_04485 [Ekhidna sp.]|nr:hypothetical protein [Ekhidna sp.]MBC6425723.1 hypothetical protein [Ekhidna sp.]
MIFDTSYFDKKIEKQINEAVGKSFSFKERCRLKGIGSKRLTITNISEEYRKYLNAEHYQSKANIELRPKGIIVHFRHKLQAYCWIMPFSDLEIKNEKKLSLASNGKFIDFIEQLEESFLEKINSTKAAS